MGEILRVAQDDDGGGGGSCAERRHSFAPETLVLLADGTTKPIRDVQVGDLPDLIAEYRELSCTLGRKVKVTPTGGQPFEAQALSISDDGELMVRRTNGLVEAINAADVSVRPG